ncbi:hypothetical protein GGI23_002897 [Coemansia sp. RSA 2559]|nr:hypothetical protein GGI23_002897 [Coemansia sp. RSA 2559]KAJ2863879.1 hypothetical protein GGI22_001850 [Coemansia erecta]
MALPLLVVLVASVCCAQVEMREPPPRRSKFSKFYITADDVDYNMKSPLGGKISYPCRNASPGPVQGTLVAGQDLKVFFDGTATRQGGDCQFAISYDNGTSFAVLWDKLDNCFLDTINGGYEVPVPDRLPAAKSAVFAWAWIPKIGTRGYYMNCADVRVENYGKQQAYIGKELLVVNVPGKPNLASLKSSEKDSLSAMLDDRAQITVGEPVGSSDPTNAPEGGAANDDGASSVDEQNGDDDNAAKPQDEDNGASGTVVLYLSESTMTSTEIVYLTEYLTEDDTDYNALYTYGAGIQTRGQLSTTLGPYVKPLFGTNVGLTIDPDSAEATSSGGAIAHLSFTDDLASPWPTGSAKWLGSESQDYIPPSLPGPQTTASPSNTVDLLMASNSNGLSQNAVPTVADSMYPAATPLFSTPHRDNVASLSADGINADPPLPQGSDALSGGTVPDAVATNRPSYKSVTDKVNKAMLNHTHSSIAELPPAPHATTILSTVTMDGKPVLQVVVSMDSSVVPESLTIAY